MLNREKKDRPKVKEIEVLNPEEKEKGWPFEIDHASDDIITKEHGISKSDYTELAQGAMSKLVIDTGLGDKEKGKFSKGVYVEENYETEKGPKDIFFFIYLENLGKENEDDKENKIVGHIVKVDYIEPGEVNDNFLDFMNLYKEKGIFKK